MPYANEICEFMLMPMSSTLSAAWSHYCDVVAELVPFEFECQLNYIWMYNQFIWWLFYGIEFKCFSCVLGSQIIDSYYLTNFFVIDSSLSLVRMIDFCTDEKKIKLRIYATPRFKPSCLQYFKLRVCVLSWNINISSNVSPPTSVRRCVAVFPIETRLKFCNVNNPLKKLSFHWNVDEGRSFHLPKNILQRNALFQVAPRNGGPCNNLSKPHIPSVAWKRPPPAPEDQQKPLCNRN